MPTEKRTGAGEAERMTGEDEVVHVWTIGSYPTIATQFLGMAAALVDAAGVGPDDDVLDVGCGTGNVAVTAARRGATVTGLDITPAMLEDARENAAIAGVPEIEWRRGDAADLPFGDDAFDVTLSCVGHMFAEPPEAVARELLRVTRPGGRIAFTAWTPESVVPAASMAMAEYLPDDPDPSPPPFLWGDPAVVEERLGDGVADLAFETGTVFYPELSPAHFWEGATRESGMFMRALEAVEEADRPALREAVIRAAEPFFDDGRNAVRMEYQLATATVA